MNGGEPFYPEQRESAIYLIVPFLAYLERFILVAILYIHIFYMIRAAFISRNIHNEEIRKSKSCRKVEKS